MSAFGCVQAEFARAVRDPARRLPGALAASAGIAPAKRFAVYRNNVVVGLVDALRTRFPAIERIVGADFFVFLARTFIDVHPPQSPVLAFFGDRLPDFIECFQPSSELRYLADVARIECARTHAYHAHDATPADLSGLLSLPPDAMAGAKLVMHPAVAVVRSMFPAFTIWSMNSRDDGEPEPVDFSLSQDTLIVRPEFDVFVEPLPAGGADFLDALRRAALGDAANETAKRAPAFDLTGTLALLIKAGAFAGFETAPIDGYQQAVPSARCNAKRGG